MSDTLAVIPARSGSKGLPDKNIRPLSGKPLMAWSIEQANSSEQVDEAIVSTDSEYYAEIARDYGGSVPFIRPEAYARDDSPTADVIRHALEWWRDERNREFDEVALLEPTSPLRADGDIDEAIDLFRSHPGDPTSLVSVGEVELEHPLIVKRISDGYVEPYVEHDRDIYRRQNLPPAYFPYGVIYLSDVESYEVTETFYQDRTVAYEIERWQKYEIDDIYDFICVERVIEYRRGEGEHE